MIFWMAPVQSDPSFHWAFRIVPLALALLLLWHWLGTLAEPTLKEGLRMIQPATDSVCPFCATPLLAETKWQMIVCRVRCPVLSIDVIYAPRTAWFHRLRSCITLFV